MLFFHTAPFNFLFTRFATFEMANKKSPLPYDYRYRLPPGGNKKPPSFYHIREFTVDLFFYDCRLFHESEDRLIRKHKSLVRSSSDLSVTVREIVISIWSCQDFSPLLILSFRSVSQWTLYDFFSLPLKDRSTIDHVRLVIHSFHFRLKL